MKNLSRVISLFIFVVIILVIFGFFYFETSTILRILVIFLGLVGLTTVKKTPEILIITILYLGLYDLYNVRYGLAIPLALILVAVFVLATTMFYLLNYFNKVIVNLDRYLFLTYLVTTGLIVMEIFLTMTFWPVDPKIKSLVIVVVFYLMGRIFYLYINSMLHLKKILTIIFLSLVILGAVLLFNLFSLSGF